MGVIYRVKIKVSYCTAYFDFNNIREAGEFATQAFIHSNDEGDNISSVGISLVRKGDSDEEE